VLQFDYDQESDTTRLFLPDGDVNLTGFFQHIKSLGYEQEAKTSTVRCAVSTNYKLSILLSEKKVPSVSHALRHSFTKKLFS
jgi:hypothetical protein